MYLVLLGWLLAADPSATQQADTVLVAHMLVNNEFGTVYPLARAARLVQTIAEAGDNIVSARNLYGGTYTQFNDILPKLGITVTEITNAIKAQNTVNPAGQIGGMLTETRPAAEITPRTARKSARRSPARRRSVFGVTACHARSGSTSSRLLSGRSSPLSSRVSKREILSWPSPMVTVSSRASISRCARGSAAKSCAVPTRSARAATMASCASR